MARISIIVPVYNVEAYIHRCVDSILSQTFDDFELILVNDGSSDGSGYICDEYSQKDTRIIVVHQTNKGVSAARNAGIEIARCSNSEWLCFIDSDDWVHPQMLELLYETSMNHNSKISICAFQNLSDYVVPPPVHDNSVILWNTEDLYVSLTVNAIIPCAKLFHKDLFDDIRFPVGVRFEDERTIYKALFKVEQIPFIIAPLYFYFDNPTGFMNTRNIVAEMDSIPAFEETLQFFEERGYAKAFNARINVYFHKLTNLLKRISLLSFKNIRNRSKLHKMRLLLFLRMNPAQRARVCNELHPRIMHLYWLARAGIKMVMRGEWKNAISKMKNHI